MLIMDPFFLSIFATLHRGSARNDELLAAGRQDVEQDQSSASGFFLRAYRAIHEQNGRRAISRAAHFLISEPSEG
jgi:hypothetical protein